MKTTKMLSIVGAERGDFPYFLARTFEEKKFRILVIDNSCSHDLFLSLNHADETSDYVERGRTVFMRNKTVEPDETGALEKFDIVIVFHGYNVDYDLIDLSDKLVCLTDYLPTTHRYIKEYIDMAYVNAFDKENLYLVLLDKPSGKVSEQVIKNNLSLTGIENEAIIYYDEGCYNAYINLCYNGAQSLKGLSAEYRNSLKEIREAILGETRRMKKVNDREGEK